jgi:uncharacterized protein
MAATATKKEMTIESKMDALLQLQLIDSEIDRIRTIRGELPLEVQDLEDELEGLGTRISNMQEEIKEIETEVTDRKNAVKDAEFAISKYKEQQDKVRNNREFESLAKEIEFQELESKEAKIRISSKKEVLDEALERMEFRKTDLKTKKAELDEIVAETQKDEDKLQKDSDAAKAKIDARLITAYERLRGNSKNGLAVVSVERDACGGCFNKIPPQRQLDIATKRKVIVCEHCGRILVPAPEEK